MDIIESITSIRMNLDAYTQTGRQQQFLNYAKSASSHISFEQTLNEIALQQKRNFRCMMS